MIKFLDDGTGSPARQAADEDALNHRTLSPDERDGHAGHHKRLVDDRLEPPTGLPFLLGQESDLEGGPSPPPSTSPAKRNR